MSDEYTQRLYKQMQREIAEVETPRGRYQAIIDQLWWDKAEAAAEERRLKRELDPYGLGLYDDDFHVLKKG